MDYEDKGSREELHMENLCLKKSQCSWRSIKMERTLGKSPSITNTGDVGVHTKKKRILVLSKLNTRWWNYLHKMENPEPNEEVYQMYHNIILCSLLLILKSS
jgi:hypothetical protein